jgi:CubicO group peptidase (beta-lactamase class C family)
MPGMTEPGFEGVAQAFEETLEGSLGGAAFAAFVDGRPVVDVWGGTADAEGGRPWEESTAAIIFSGTKGLIAVCMLELVERGLIDLDEPVARYWPEFAAAGKETVLVRHVLGHTAGVPGLMDSFSSDELIRPEEMTVRVAAEPPFWPPGERLAYHAFTYGWICGELIRRTDGRSAGRFLAEEVVEPLGLDAWLGLPEGLESRVAKLVARPDYVLTVVGDEPAPLLSAQYGRWDGGGTRFNDPEFHRAEIPGGGGIATARSVARLYACLACGGALDGVVLLRPETVELGRTELSRGLCEITRRPYAFAAGFELTTELGRLGPEPDAFGHTGSGGSTHGAWPSLRTGFSYVMTELRPELADDRGRLVLAALRDAIG